MDAGLLKVGILAAIGLTLLVPTFNALNNSYVENVTPPPWFPTPPTPPDITPPSNFKPPPDMTPPSNFKGKIPPNACPPPVVESLMNQTASFDSSQTANGFERSYPFTIKNGTIGFGGYINWTWQAASIHATITGPPGYKTWSNGNFSQQTQGVLFDPQPTTTSWKYNSYDETSQPAKAGKYTLTVSADKPLQGSVTITWAAVLACGGLGSS